jgi:hypothetical protein
MSFDRYFKFSSYLLVTSGFLAVVAAGGAGTIAEVLFVCALGGSWFVDTERLGRALPPRFLNTLILVYLLFYAADLRFVSRSFMTSTIHLILFLAGVKLLIRSSDRDWIYLYLISFAELIAAAALSTDIVFALALLLFLFSAVSALVLLEMRASNEWTQRMGRVDPLIETRHSAAGSLRLLGRFPAAKMALLGVMMTATILALVVPLFLVLPRVSFGIWRHPHGPTRLVSGFSERVALGEIGTIKESDAEVMKIRPGQEVARRERGSRTREGISGWQRPPAARGSSGRPVSSRLFLPMFSLQPAGCLQFPATSNISSATLQARCTLPHIPRENCVTRRSPTSHPWIRT